MADPDWTDVTQDMRLHIVQNATNYIDGQIRLATAADQRASALAGVFTAAGTALIAAMIAFGTGALKEPLHPYPMLAAGSACAASFLLAGFFCIFSALPVDMYLPGGQPKTWDCDIKLKRPYDDCLKEEASNLQDKINDNRVIIKRNAALFRVGALFGIAGPAVGLVVWLLTSSTYWF
jgi:hypothetical protein